MSILASSSTGNATYAESEKGSLLAGIGLIGKKMGELFSQVDRNTKDLNGVLVIHGCIGRIKGLDVLVRKYRPPIHTNENTQRTIEKKDSRILMDQKFISNPYETKSFTGFDIESFNVSHDVVDPQLYTFHNNYKKFTMITDTGYVSDHMRGITQGGDVFMFESNHDVDMLCMCRYPWKMKQRILSDMGHVSNEDTDLAVSDVIAGDTKRIYFSHLSQDSSMEDLTHMNIGQVLNEHDIDTGKEMSLCGTDKAQATPIYIL